MSINYYKIIHKHIKPNTKLYPIFITHSTLVTKKALKIARKLNLSNERIQFVEEASMLHDIGIYKTDDSEIFCFGKKHYITHGIEGEQILLKEGLPKHAKVASHHTGSGVFKEDIDKYDLPIPKKDYLAKTLEQEIISYADLFFSKIPEFIWQEKSLERVKKSVSKFGTKHLDILNSWIEKFD